MDQRLSQDNDGIVKWRHINHNEGWNQGQDSKNVTHQLKISDGSVAYYLRINRSTDRIYPW